MICHFSHFLPCDRTLGVDKVVLQIRKKGFSGHTPVPLRTVFLQGKFSLCRLVISKCLWCFACWVAVSVDCGVCLQRTRGLGTCHLSPMRALPLLKCRAMLQSLHVATQSGNPQLSARLILQLSTVTAPKTMIFFFLFKPNHVLIYFYCFISGRLFTVILSIL